VVGVEAHGGTRVVGGGARALTGRG
jgi:hypothetical protein